MSDVKAFQCPNCRQFINNLMTSCKFCSIPLDAQTVANAVSNQDVVNDAYNSASNVRILAGAMLTFFFLSFVPFLGLFFSILQTLLYWLIMMAAIILKNVSLLPPLPLSLLPLAR